VAEVADTAELSDTVVLYGFRKRHRAARLMNSLAEIPCYPSTIYRIDQQGRYYGALDQLRHCIYYIHVLNWCDRRQSAPVIRWSDEPAALAKFLVKAGPAALIRFTSGIRVVRPMTLKTSYSEHAALYAKMMLSAS
jgi:hypothetical protein